MLLLNYSNEPVKTYGRSVFLAGPTPRSKDVKSWRPEAIGYFREFGFDGTLYIPEHSDGSKNIDKPKQYAWEWEALDKATVILFWIPRNRETMLGLTTNNEMGYYGSMKKAIYGRPNDAWSISYQDAWYRRFHGIDAPIYTDLKTMCEYIAKNPFVCIF